MPAGSAPRGSTQPAPGDIADPRGPVPPGYVPRRPAETVLYAIVRDHLEAFLAHARETYDRGLPRYVEQAFRSYLECGIFSHGFLRFHCDDCSRDLLVAFSCKGRGICPSCGARRMCNSAAHAVDRVLPAVPVRQYVLSLPFELRRAAAFRADVATALGRIFIEAIATEQKRTAGLAQSELAALNHIQRFGGAINLNLHFHAVVVDGVFVPDDAGRVRFHETGAPSREALERIVRRMRDRTLRWLRKNGLLEERPAEDQSNEAPETNARGACADIALRGGAFATIERAEAAQTGEAGEARFEPKHRGPMTAELDGFNVQAAVRIEADDDEGRELLLRYCARPCFGLERLSVLPDGRVAYRVKYAGRGGTHRIMTPVEFLARLAALVAPPKYPLVRYHGVLAPHSKWRSAVVPRPPPAAHAPENPLPPSCDASTKGHTPASTEMPPAPRRPDPPPRPPVQCRRGSQPNAAPQMAAASPKLPPAAAACPLPPAIAAQRRGAAMQTTNRAAILACADVEITDFGISVHHLDRLLGGLLLATSPRVDWAKLLHRTYAVDVLRCGRCGGRLRVLAAITEKATAKKILAHLGLPTEPIVARPRARDPAEFWAGTPNVVE